MNLSYRILLDPSGAEGGTTPPAPPATPPAAPPPPAKEPAEMFARLLHKHDGDATKLASKLFTDNYKLRNKLAATEGSTPPAGSRVLTREEADEFDLFRSIGKPAEIQEAVKDRDRFRDEADGLRRAEIHKQAAEACGFKAPVLSDLINRDKLNVEVKEEKVNGKPAKVAWVIDQDDKGKPVETRLVDHAKARWADYLPSLANTPERPPSGTPPRADLSGPPPTTKPARKDLSLASGF